MPLCYAVDSKISGKGGERMKEEGKRVRRFRTGMNVVDLRMYFRNMAEQGFILDEMDHLQFVFLEKEPQYLRYRVETLDHAPTAEERKQYETEGWFEVCHNELEYVFVRERDPYTEDEELEKQEIVKAIDEEIKKRTDANKTSTMIISAGMIFSLVFIFLNLGMSAVSSYLALGVVLEFLPLVVAFYAVYLAWKKKKEKERENVLYGEMPDYETEYEKGRRKQRVLSILALILIVISVYFRSQ